MARGSIRHRGKDPAAWSLIIELPPAEDGKRRQRWVAFHGTRREAERECARLQREADTGRVADPGTITVDAFLRQWLEDSAKLDLAPQSYDAYRAAVDAWQPRIGHVRLGKLTPIQIQTAVRKTTEAGLRPATVRRYHAVLHRALRQAVEWELLARNPADHIVLPRADPVRATPLTPEQALALLGAARAHPKGMVIILAVGLGLRAGECLALSWGDVDLAAGLVHVRGSMQRNKVVKAPKSGKPRTVVMPEFVRIALAQARAAFEQNRAIGGDRWNPQERVVHGCAGQVVQINSAEIMGALCKAAGVPRVRLHDLRHSFATLLLSAGESVKHVSQALGHADVRITLSEYSHVLPGTEGRLAARMDRLLGER